MTLLFIFSSCYINLTPELKKRKVQYESELEGLGTLRELQLREVDALEKVSGLERKIHYAAIEEVIFSYSLFYFTSFFFVNV